MAFFVRPSKYRHVYGTCAKRDFSYDNLRVSANAWDTNMVKANPVSCFLFRFFSKKKRFINSNNSSFCLLTGKLQVEELSLLFLIPKLVSYSS
jgi:hypothetical protein